MCEISTVLRTAEYSYIIYPYILHKQQLALASVLQKDFAFGILFSILFKASPLHILSQFLTSLLDFPNPHFQPVLNFFSCKVTRITIAQQPLRHKH